MKFPKLKLMFFRNYVKTQELKMKLIAEASKGLVLDIGGAQNPNPYFGLNDSIKEVWLLDIVEPQHLPDKYIKFVKFDLNKVVVEPLPFNDETFDTVILADVIEHLHYPLLVLREAYRILIRDGTLILSIPSPRYYLELLFTALTGKPMRFPEHITLYTRAQICYLLEQLGFKVHRVIGYSFWLPIVKLGFVNISLRLPEFLTWQQIYIATKVRKIR
jgi:SAM-dependent methyltransferase